MSPHHIEDQAGLAFSSLQRHYNAKSGNVQERLQKEDSVLLFPVIQAGQFGIREEEDCLRLLYDHLGAADCRDMTPDLQPLLSLTSGYFGLSNLYKNLIIRSHVPTRIICASPEVHLAFLLSKRIMTNFCQSPGEWLLRFPRNIWSSS